MKHLGAEHIENNPKAAKHTRLNNSHSVEEGTHRSWGYHRRGQPFMHWHERSLDTKTQYKGRKQKDERSG